MLTAAFFFWALGFLLFWRVARVGSDVDSSADVSVIVPARNEAENIVRLLESVQQQRPRPCEVIVVDDGSDDATADLSRAAGASVVTGDPLPDGWAGKPWACWQGAQRARGELLLFLDADTWLEPGALVRLCGEFGSQRGLLSVQPYHQMSAAYERLGALFNLITMIGTGAFTVLGARIAPRLAFGPCVLVDRATYMATGGHERAAGSVVEGSQLARAYREAGHPVRCLAGRGAVRFRMYPGGLRSMVDGLVKSFATGAGGVPVWLLVPTVAWVVGAVTTTRVLLVAAITSAAPPTAALVLAALYAVQMYFMLTRVGNYGIWPALVFPAPVAFFLGVFGVSAFRTFVRRRVSWKGRSVSVR